MVRLALVMLASLLGLAAAAHAQDARVEAFQRVCIDARESYAASEAAALGGGWAAASESSRPELQRIFAFARTADASDTPLSKLQAYANDQQRDTAIVLSEMTVEGRLINGCYVYDFAATEALDPAVFVRIVGSQPTEAQSYPGLIVMQKWIGPVALEGVATLRAGFVPPGSEAGAQIGFTGLALALTSFSRGEAQ